MQIQDPVLMSTKLPQLYYLSDNKSVPLPEWAYFFLRLGHQLGNLANDGYRVVTALAIPTRAFACGLVATGIVLARIGRENPVSKTQLRHIRSLKPGTSVHVRTDGNKRLSGVFNGLVNFQGKEYISVRIAESTQQYFPLNTYASRVTVSEGDVNLPKYQQSGRLIEAPGEFLQWCLGEDLAQTYILNSSFEALLIGKKSTIQQEIDSPVFSSSPTQPGTVIGTLQEILRVRQFSGANKSYRTECLSSSNPTPEEELGLQAPPVIVFDGAVAYIKFGHKWQSAHQIILLDRTERQFMDATELLNQNYIYRLAGNFKFPIRIPSAIEMMVYRNSVP